jgi:hypothetical protein
VCTLMSKIRFFFSPDLPLKSNALRDVTVRNC